MKNVLIVAILLLVTHFNLRSQNLIAVQNGGTPAFYTTLDLAITNAQNGDTIYLPGGSFALGVVIDKKLTIIGSGSNPDSTLATNRTVIGGPVYLGDGADNGSLTGCYVNVYNGSPHCIFVQGNINQYAITRCYLHSGISFNQTISSSFLIAENVIGITSSFSIELSGSNHLISNNIIRGRISSAGSNVFRNNIFLYNGPLLVDNDTFENNIFCSGKGTATNCLAKNNLEGFINGIDGQNNQGINNYVLGATSIDDIFVSYESAVGWSQSSNFHLAAGSPYQNAGDDGTDIGIYGGAFPWKEGSIPFNPHYQTINIAPVTDPSGDLNVNIKVAAQDR